MFTTTKQPEAGTCPEQFSWTLSLARWTRFARVPSANSFAQTILFSGKQVLATIGLKATTQRVPSSSTPFLMLSVRRLRDAIAYKVSKCVTRSEVAQGLAWERCLSLKLGRST